MLIGDIETAKADFTNIFHGLLPHVRLGLMLRVYWSILLECPPYFSSPNSFYLLGLDSYFLQSHITDFVT